MHKSGIIIHSRSLSWVAAIVLATLVANLHAASNVTATDIESGQVVLLGKLGQPLGVALRMECIVRKRPVVLPKNPLIIHYPNPDGEIYDLEVVAVNGTKLPKPVIMEFKVEAAARVAPNDRALSRLIEYLAEGGGIAYHENEDENKGILRGEDPLSKEEIAAFKEGYVNSSHVLVGYETGRFHGTPQGVPRGYDFYVSGSLPYKFSTHLVILGEIGMYASTKK